MTRAVPHHNRSFLANASVMGRDPTFEKPELKAAKPLKSRPDGFTSSFPLNLAKMIHSGYLVRRRDTYKKAQTFAASCGRLSMSGLGTDASVSLALSAARHLPKF
jgi:hypothetical protein